MSKSHKAFALRLNSIQNTIPENQSCCECSASNPDWAFFLTLSTSTSTSGTTTTANDNKEDRIGAFICSTCSTAHKKLNERLGSVKSIAVGAWTTADVRAMVRGGNHVINQVFEHSIMQHKSTIKPTESSDITERRLFLELKYGTRKFYSADAAARLLIPSSPNNGNNNNNNSNTSTKPAEPSDRAASLSSLGLSSSQQKQQHQTPSQSGRRGVRRFLSNDDEWEVDLSPQTKTPSRSGRRGVRRAHSLDEWEVNLSPQKTPSRSGKRGVRRAHSNEEWDANLSPMSTGVYSMSMSTISTKSTLFGGGKHNRVQIIKEPMGGRLEQGVSLGSFIEATNNSSSDLQYNHNNNNRNHHQLKKNSLGRNNNKNPSILEAAGKRGVSMREFNLEENHRDTMPKMCRRVQSSRTLSLGDGGYSHSQEGSGSSSRHSRSIRSGGRRTKSLDTEEVFGTMETDPIMDADAERRSPRGSMGSTQQRRRRTGSTGGSSSSRQQQEQSLESGVSNSTSAQQQPLSLDSGSSVVRLRGSMGGRRMNSTGQHRANLSRRNLSLDSDGIMGSPNVQQARMYGRHRANMSRRNLSLDSDDIMGSPRVQTSIALRRESLTESTPSQRERPKYTRKLDDSEQGMMMAPAPPHKREPWMEGKTPRTTGRRKSVDMDTAPSRKNPFNGGMKNPMDRSERSQSSREPSATQTPQRNDLLGPNTSNHGAGPGVLRRGRSKPNSLKSSSARSIMSSKDEFNNDTERSTSNRSISSRSIQKRHGGLISGDKRSRGLDSLRGSLGGRKSTDSDLTSSRLGSTAQSSRPSSNAAVAAGVSRTSSNDLGSKLDLIDKESASGYNVFGHEHKSPTSPLTTSTGSKRIPRSLRLVVHAQEDDTRTFVSAMTGNSSLDSSWSLHKERWKA